MEAVAALSLACNVLQVAQLGYQAASSFAQAYKNSKTDENADIETRTQHLSRALARLDASSHSARHSEDAELLSLSRQCAEVANVLSEKLASFSQNTSRRRDRWRNGLKALRVKGEVESLALKLLQYQHMLDTTILVDLRSRVDIASLKHSKMLATLDVDLQTFIRQQVTLQRDEHELTRATVLQQSNDISERLKSMQLSQAETASYQQLVSSLKFPGMNGRKNQIAVAHYETLQWIFRGQQSQPHIKTGINDYEADDAITTSDISHETLEANNAPYSGELEDNQATGRLNFVSGVEPGDAEPSNSAGSPRLPADQQEHEASLSAWLESKPIGDTSTTKRPPPSSIEKTRDVDEVDSVGETSFLEQQYVPDDFVEWLTKRNDNYWVTGKPGSGKSTLMSFIVNHHLTLDHLQQWTAPWPIQTIDAYFWNSGSGLQRSFKGMLATIMLQLLEQASDIMKRELMNVHGIRQKTNLDDWSTGDLEHQVHALLSATKGKFCVFLDGLDEVEVAPSESDDVVVSFVEAISQLKNVKCCISSRPLRLFELAFENHARLHLERLNYPDIDRYFRDRLQLSMDKIGVQLPRNDFEQLRFQFNQKADGVFLWAHLALNGILQGLRYQDAISHLLKRLDAMPPELESLYEHMLSLSNRNSDLYQKEAATFIRTTLLLLEYERSNIHLARPNLLQFTLCFDHRFSSATASDIKHDHLAEACRLMRIRIITRCVGILNVKTGYGYDRRSAYDSLPLPLVLAHERNQQLSLVHRTAKDFLLSSPAGRRMWEGLADSDTNLNETFLKAMLKEQSLSIKPVQPNWLDGLIGDISGRRHMWTEEALSELLEHVEDALAQITMPYLREDQRNWFMYLADVWEVEKSSNDRGFMRDTDCLPDRAPLDLLGFITQHGYYALMHTLCAWRIKRLNPEYCLYLLSSLSTGYIVEWPDDGMELCALLASRLAKSQDSHSVRLLTRSDTTKRREAALHSALTDICPGLLKSKPTTKHSELSRTFQSTKNQHRPGFVALVVEFDRNSCYLVWLPTISLWMTSGDSLCIILKLDSYQLLSWHTASHSDSSIHQPAHSATSVRDHNKNSLEYFSKVEGIDTENLNYPAGSQEDPYRSVFSDVFHRTSEADSLMIRSVLLRILPITQFMTLGQGPFTMNNDIAEELRRLTEQVRGRSREIRYMDYFREQGILVDADDARALHEPPPMYVDEGEDLNDPGPSVIRRDTADSLGVDEFYDAETGI